MANAHTGKKQPQFVDQNTDPRTAFKRYANSRLQGLRVYRYSWWVHWRELADYILPRRYKWLITPNQASRGSPINQHILDSTGTIAARNLAAGIMSGASSPTRRWFKLKVGLTDSTQTSPLALWLAECERLMMLVFQQSNFYTALAILYLDLVVFGTATMLIYEDFEEVINCFNPCAGEYFIENSGRYRVDTFAREFTMTCGQIVDEFGYENCSVDVQKAYDNLDGSGLSREKIIGHLIEPNNDPRRFGVPSIFKFREIYWEVGSAQGTDGVDQPLRVQGYYEKPHVAPRWDLVSNDSYGRGPSMDAYPDIRQLQQETKRKAQAVDKQVNPPLLADVVMKNQPASLLPGGITYIPGLMAASKPGMQSVYDTKFDVAAITEDLNEVRERIKKIFYNDLFQTASQYETRSNITAVEWDMRKAESLVMLGPVYERLQNELLAPAVERVFSIMARKRILPPAPPEVQGNRIDIEYISMLSTTQAATQATGIERLFQMVGQLMGIDPAAGDNVDIDEAIDIYSDLLGNDPKIIRSPQALAQIRQMRQQQQQQAQQAEMAEKLAAGAKTMSETDVGGGQNALQKMTGVPA